MVCETSKNNVVTGKNNPHWHKRPLSVAYVMLYIVMPCGIHFDRKKNVHEMSCFMFVI